ncbi:MAG: hypothetical protein M1818_003052 [Claussenomyces sp. TS43310]|nr:MAG: hypothetical protein M1818_003052 [Claussenomyces sp. TS43310]
MTRVQVAQLIGEDLYAVEKWMIDDQEEAQRIKDEIVCFKELHVREGDHFGVLCYEPNQPTREKARKRKTEEKQIEAKRVEKERRNAERTLDETFTGSR